MKTDPHSQAHPPAQTRSVTPQVVLGLLVIGFGLLFLLDNLDVIEMNRAIGFWPMVFIIAGTVKLSEHGSRSNQAFGVFLVGLGVLLILDRLGVIDFDLGTLWPLLLIGLGALIVYKSRRARSCATSAKDGAVGMADGQSDSFISATAILGGFERRISTPALRGGEITAIMGGCELDMRGASIQGEAVLNVFAFWGGVSIKCPPDWTVVLEGTPILGGFEEKTATPPDNSKRLIIRGYAVMGGVDVRN